MEWTKFKSLDDVIAYELQSYQNGDYVRIERDKDGYKSALSEKLFSTHTIEDGKSVISTFPGLKQHPFWTVGEIISEMFALNPPIMHKYRPELVEWSYELQPDKTVRYMYGRRWNEFQQLENTFKKLSKNPSTKKAIVDIFTPYDTHPDLVDVPCTVMYNFSLRDDKLHMATYFRSHDFFAGLKYDPLLSSFIQQTMAMWLNTESSEKIVPGELVLHDMNLHIYDKDLPKLEKLLQQVSEENPPKFDVMFDYDSIENYWDDMWNIRRAEESSYWGNFEASEDMITKIINPAFRDFARIFYNRNAGHSHFSKRLEYEIFKRWTKYERT